MDPETMYWDVLVIGTGMGGATLGHALAEAGRRVLFIERGLDLRPEGGQRISGRFVEDIRGFGSRSSTEKNHDLACGGRSTDTIDDMGGGRRSPYVPYVGSGTGGSSALYGMNLERFFPIDFVPGSAFQDRRGSSLPDKWPISYEDLRPWYEQAERLYRVRGTPDALRVGENGAGLFVPPPLSPQSAHLFDALTARGVHPYRAHTASEQVPDCHTCEGYLCPFSCKNDAARICLTPALEQHGAHLLTECTATFLEANRKEVRRVVCSWRGRRIELRAKVVVLAAGALLTPALLLNSRSDSWPTGLANDSDMVGRNLMQHSLDLWVLTKAPKLSENTWNKEIAFNDLYTVGDDKLGTVQAPGPPAPPALLREANFNLWRLLGPLASFAWERFSKQPMFSAILEDLPYPENRVWPRSTEPQENNRLCLRYRVGESELRRRRVFRKALASVLGPFHPIRVFRTGTGDRRPRLGHVCGTCRFGTDPDSSVLDPWNRAHGIANLYVVDGSFFPSSAGPNPSLSIAANALRVARHLTAST
jgi:choline dehydrogenase-like flavoprotein